MNTKKKFPNRGGWVTEITQNADGSFETRIYNPDPETGLERWYESTTEGSQYGNPMVVEEPANGIPAPKLGLHQHKDVRVVGIVVVEDGQVTDRFSITKATVVQGRTVDAKDGALEVDGEVVYPAVLVDSNRPRIDGVIAVCTRERLVEPEQVRHLEAVQDLFGFALQAAGLE